MGNHPPDAAEYRDRRIVRVRRQPHARFLSHLHTYLTAQITHLSGTVTQLTSALRSIEGQITEPDAIVNYYCTRTTLTLNGNSMWSPYKTYGAPRLSEERGSRAGFASLRPRPHATFSRSPTSPGLAASE